MYYDLWRIQVFTKILPILQVVSAVYLSDIDISVPTSSEGKWVKANL